MAVRTIPLVVLVMIATGTVVAQVPPLDQATRTKLEGGAYRGTLWEPALAGLLANAAAWPADLEEQATTARRFHRPSVEAEPDAYRGDLFELTGALRAPLPLAALVRQGEPLPEGAGQMRAWTLDVPGEAGGRVLVVLTAPPPLEVVDRDGNLEVVAERGQMVRTVGRFFKWLALDSREGAVRLPVFVGRTAEFAVEQPGEGTGMEKIVPWLIGGLVMLLLLAYGAIRFGYRRQAEVTEGHRRRREEEAVTVADAIEIRDDLPEDPAEAMSVLEAEHEQAWQAFESQPADADQAAADRAEAEPARQVEDESELKDESQTDHEEPPEDADRQR